MSANPGAVVGLKTLSSPANNVALIHHMHHAAALQGQHNLGMINGSTSSSQSSSSLGGHNGGVDPLIRDHHSHHHHHSGLGHNHHHHHHHHHRRSMHRHQQDEDDVLSDEQGVLSSDEANYQRHSHHHHHGSQLNEGFRDSNELTINADTVLNGAGSTTTTTATGSGVRRRIYSTNGSIGRAAASNRISANLSLAEHQANSGQHQRLVSASTPSTSTRSSRASPPSDDHSLDQLAYGNSWHPNSAANQQQQQQDSSSNNNSAGSGASILGAGSRANLRY